ncbi:MAG TPA: hypothetical protein VD973_16385 [Symbiobacteriaceae bacterium]|nr:hypothetical protein [Symbiobacteriaceae bacterium]
MDLRALTQAFDELMGERRFAQAVLLCDEALSTRLPPPLRCRVLQFKAEALLTDGRQWEGPALACLRDALSFTRPNSLDRARVLTAMTAAYASLTSIANCREARDELAVIASRRRTPVVGRLLPHAEYNLAYIYHELSDLEAAEDGYLRALKHCYEQADPATNKLRLKILHNLIDIFQEVGRNEHAYAIMEQVYPNLDDAVYGAQTRNRRAAHALYEGDTHSAILWVESGLGHPGCDPKTKAALYLTKAKIAHAMGAQGAAREYAMEASRLAKAAECNRLVCRALRFLDQVPKGV